MSEIELTKLSSKGQVVIPQTVREELGLEEGETFAVIGRDDTIVLKKLQMPSKKEVFEKIHAWGVSFAKKKGLKEGDLQKLIERSRGKNDSRRG